MAFPLDSPGVPLRRARSTAAPRALPPAEGAASLLARIDADLGPPDPPVEPGSGPLAPPSLAAPPSPSRLLARIDADLGGPPDRPADGRARPAAYEAVTRGDLSPDEFRAAGVAAGVAAADPALGSLYETALAAPAGPAREAAERAYLAAGDDARRRRQAAEAPDVLARLDARLDPTSRRPIDADESALEQLGRGLNTGLFNARAALVELGGQAADAVGLDAFGRQLQGEAEQIRAAAQRVPIGQQTVENRALREQVAAERVQPGQIYSGSGFTRGPEAPRARNQAEALAEALRRDPGGTLRATAGQVAESAPEMAAGLATTALRGPRAAVGLYGALGAGRQLGDAAGSPTAPAEREDVGARAGAAAVASGVVGGLTETFADRLLIGRVGQAARAAGLGEAAQRTFAREVAAGVGRVAGTAGRQSRDEALTEAVQTVIENAGARVGWEPGRDLLDGVAEAMLVGAVAGGALGGGGAAVGQAAGAVERAAPARAARREADVLRAQMARTTLGDLGGASASFRLPDGRRVGVGVVETDNGPVAMWAEQDEAGAFTAEAEPLLDAAGQPYPLDAPLSTLGLDPAPLGAPGADAVVSAETTPQAAAAVRPEDVQGPLGGDPRAADELPTPLVGPALGPEAEPVAPENLPADVPVPAPVQVDADRLAAAVLLAADDAARAALASAFEAATGRPLTPDESTQAAERLLAASPDGDLRSPAEPARSEPRSVGAARARLPEAARDGVEPGAGDSDGLRLPAVGPAAVTPDALAGDATGGGAAPPAPAAVADQSPGRRPPDAAGGAAAGAQLSLPTVSRRPDGRAAEPVARFLARNRAALREAADAEVLAIGDDLDWNDVGTAEAQALDRAAGSSNPAVLLDAWAAARRREDAELGSARETGSVDAAIADFLPMMRGADYAETGGDDFRARRAYFRAGSKPNGMAYPSLDEAAEAVTAESGMPVSTAAVLDFVARFPAGPSAYRAAARAPRRAIETRFKAVTGAPLTPKRYAELAAALAEDVPEPVAERPDYGASNRLVTRAAYDDALATLGATVPFSNPFADPAMLAAAVKVATFHVEAGARSFADFSARMLRDLGADARPHLDRLFRDATAAWEAAPPAEPDVAARLDAAGLGDALRALAAQVAPPPPSAAPVLPTGPTAEPREDAPMPARLTKAQGARVRAALALDTLPPAARQTWAETVERVTRSGLVDEIEARAALVVATARPAPLSADEHAALLVRLALVQDRYREAADAVVRADTAGQPADELRVRALALLGSVDLLTRASDLAGTAAGQALAVRRLAVQADGGGSFTVASVLRDAAVAKGAPLTETERNALADLAVAAEQATERVRRAEAKAAERAADGQARAAGRAVTSAASAEPAKPSDEMRARRAAAVAALRDEREQIKADLARLGLRLNDALGLTAEAAVLVGRLALTYAKEGAYTLAEVVARVRADVPDASEADVIRAVAGGRGGPQPRPPAGPGTSAEAETLARLRVEQARAERAVRAAQRALVTPTVGERLADVVNLPRSVLATGDMGAVGNQAAPLVRRHPVVTVRVFRRAWPTFFRAAAAEAADVAMRADVRHGLREVAGLYLAPLGDDAQVARDVLREEAFQSRLVQRMPWLARAAAGAAVGTLAAGPGVGTAVGAAGGLASRAVMAASERHMVVFLNGLRAAVFDAYADAHPDAPLDELRAYARLVNLLTGRGDLGRAAPLAPALSLALFSPRLTVARFQAPYVLVKPGVPLRVRGEAAKAFGAFVGANALLLTLLGIAAEALAGDDEPPGLVVGSDPRDADFGRIVWGPVRIDLWGGYAQQARLFLRTVLAGTDARGITERPANRQDLDPLEEAARMANSKKAPWIGLLQALWTGRDFLGRQTPAGETLSKALTPIGIGSAREAFATGATPREARTRAAAVAVLNFFGLGADAYDDPTASASVKPFFERAEYRWTPSPPDDLTPEQEAAYTEDVRARVAAAVGRAGPELARIADADTLKTRLRGLVADAREEARGQATGDPLASAGVLVHLRRADYRPSPSPPDGMPAEQHDAYAADFRARMAAAVARDAALLGSLDPPALKERLRALAAQARAEARSPYR